jgi:hypothetical protein
MTTEQKAERLIELSEDSGANVRLLAESRTLAPDVARAYLAQCRVVREYLEVAKAQQAYLKGDRTPEELKALITRHAAALDALRKIV